MKNQYYKPKNLKTKAIRSSLTKIGSLIWLIASLISLGSCDGAKIGDRYQVVFWFDENNSYFFREYGAEKLTFYINGKAVATSLVDNDIFWEKAPSCDDTKAITAHVDLLRSENVVQYKVTDQAGLEYANGTRSLTTNYCNAIEIIPEVKFEE